MYREDCVLERGDTKLSDHQRSPDSVSVWGIGQSLIDYKVRHYNTCLATIKGLRVRQVFGKEFSEFLEIGKT